MRRDGGALSMATFFLPHAKRDGACAVYAFFKMIRDALTATGSRAARGAQVARPADCSEIELRIRERIEGIYGGALELPNAEFRDETQHVLAAMTETVRRHEILRADLLEFVDASAADAN